MYVNLGIGIPTLVANYIPQELMLNFNQKWSWEWAPFPFVGEEDPDLIIRENKLLQ